MFSFLYSVNNIKKASKKKYIIIVNHSKICYNIMYFGGLSMDKKNQNLTPFFTELSRYANSQVIPMDVPGHKLGRLNNELKDALGEKFFLYDANAPKGLDNLNRPTGVIKESQELLAEAFGADRAYFLTGGTTQGILTMILSTVAAREKIILPRNVHKSIISALILSGAMPIFLPPIIDNDLGIANGVSFEAVKEAIDAHPDAKAIFIINPTYFGAVSDLASIVKYAHKHDILVLCDEAHGSHLSFNKILPLSAMEAGADLSASSLHKTGGSLTQSSVLLAKGKRVNYNKLRVTLNILQTTSPSSLLLASLDVARKYMYFKGKQELDKVIDLAHYAKKIIDEIPGITVCDKDYFINKNNYDYDETKLLIKIKDLNLPGYYLYNLLRDKYNIQVELAETYVLLVVLSIGSTKRDIIKLRDALAEISDEFYKKMNNINFKKFNYSFPKVYTRPREAFHAPKKYVELTEAIDEIAAESIMIYPPGIPLIIPGEIIDLEIINRIEFYKENGFTILTEQDDETVKIIDRLNWFKGGDYDDF